MKGSSRLISYYSKTSFDNSKWADFNLTAFKQRSLVMVLLN